MDENTFLKDLILELRKKRKVSWASLLEEVAFRDSLSSLSKCLVFNQNDVDPKQLRFTDNTLQFGLNGWLVELSQHQCKLDSVAVVDPLISTLILEESKKSEQSGKKYNGKRLSKKVNKSLKEQERRAQAKKEGEQATRKDKADDSSLDQRGLLAFDYVVFPLFVKHQTHSSCDHWIVFVLKHPHLYRSGKTELWSLDSLGNDSCSEIKVRFHAAILDYFNFVDKDSSLTTVQETSAEDIDLGGNTEREEAVNSVSFLKEGQLESGHHMNMRLLSPKQLQSGSHSCGAFVMYFVETLGRMILSRNVDPDRLGRIRFCTMSGINELLELYLGHLKQVIRKHCIVEGIKERTNKEEKKQDNATKTKRLKRKAPTANPGVQFNTPNRPKSIKRSKHRPAPSVNSSTRCVIDLTSEVEI
jgi:hypothetical protein